MVKPLFCLFHFLIDWNIWLLIEIETILILTHVIVVIVVLTQKLNWMPSNICCTPGSILQDHGRLFGHVEGNQTRKMILNRYKYAFMLVWVMRSIAYGNICRLSTFFKTREWLSTINSLKSDSPDIGFSLGI